MAQYARHVDPAFVKLLGVLGYGRVFTRAEGAYVWDEQGRRYLDLLAGFGSVNIGHNHPRLLRTAARVPRRSAAESQPHRSVTLRGAARRGARRRRRASRSRCRSSRRAAPRRSRPRSRPPRAATRRTPHRLLRARLSRPEPRHAVAELLAADAAALRAAATGMHRRAVRRRRRAGARRCAGNDVAAFVVEPVQIEGGVHFAPPGYLRAGRDALLETRHAARPSTKCRPVSAARDRCSRSSRKTQPRTC